MRAYARRRVALYAAIAMVVAQPCFAYGSIGVLEFAQEVVISPKSLGLGIEASGKSSATLNAERVLIEDHPTEEKTDIRGARGIAEVSQRCKSNRDSENPSDLSAGGESLAVQLAAHIFSTHDLPVLSGGKLGICKYGNDLPISVPGISQRAFDIQGLIFHFLQMHSANQESWASVGAQASLHDASLPPIDNQLSNNGDKSQDCEDSGPPIGRRLAIFALCFAFAFGLPFFETAFERKWVLYVGFTLFSVSGLLFLSSGERWSWCWWI